MDFIERISGIQNFKIVKRIAGKSKMKYRIIVQWMQFSGIWTLTGGQATKSK